VTKPLINSLIVIPATAGFQENQKHRCRFYRDDELIRDPGDSIGASAELRKISTDDTAILSRRRFVMFATIAPFQTRQNHFVLSQPIVLTVNNLMAQ